jgi:hypothetical protein
MGPAKVKNEEIGAYETQNVGNIDLKKKFALQILKVPINYLGTT